MADKVNPYRRWLGLVPSQPDFFQLLGIERSERRPEAIRSAAEAKLELLKSFQDDAGRPDRKKLSEEIKLAYKTLSQAEKREEYLNKLQPAVGLSPPLAVPVTVPIARPAVQTVNCDAPSVTNVPASDFSTRPESHSPKDQLAAVAELGEKSKKKHNRRSSSWLIPLLGLALFLGGPLLVLGIIWFNSSKGRITAVASNADESIKKLPVVKERSKESNHVETPFRGIIKRQGERRPNEKTTEAETEEASGESKNLMGQAPGSETMESSEEEASKAQISPGSVLSLGEYASPEVAGVIRSVWVELAFRNEEAGRRRVVSKKEFITDPVGIQQLAAIEEAIGLSEAFWKQVISSCRMMKTGEIRFGDEVAMFNESTDQHIVLKFKGMLVQSQLTFLPKEIAIELAERGKIDDIPSWRLQKSAVLMQDPSDAKINEQAIRELLDSSAKDGHETANLVWLLNRRLEDNQNQRRNPKPDAESKKAAVEKLNETIPDKQLAQNNLAGRNAVIQELQALAQKEKDAAIRFVALERARKHAIRKADLIICRQLIEQLGWEFDIDADEIWNESIEEMTDYVQSSQQAELICQAMIAAHGFGWPKLEPGIASEQKLASAEDLARKFDLKMTLERIRYLTGQK